MSTTKNNTLRQIAFFTLAGVENVELHGEQIVAVQKSPLPEFRGTTDGPLCAQFANWPTDASGVERFTRKFGGLRAPLSPGEKFCFDVNDWGNDQQLIRAAWGNAWHLYTKFGLRSRGELAVEGFKVEDGEEFIVRRGILEYQANSLFRFLWLEFASTPLERLRKCNREDCRTPYFFASHLGQRYCCDVCAREAQREWKKNWWKSSGTEWRENRSKKERAIRKTRKYGGAR